MKIKIGESITGKNEEYWQKIIKEVDKNNDGEIDYMEFMDMMEKS